jgi:hypothetical protein
MWYNARLGVTLALLSFTFATNIANAQDASATAGASRAKRAVGSEATDDDSRDEP